MSERNKRAIAVIGLIVTLVLLWLLFKRSPSLVKAVESALAPAVAGSFDVPLVGAYTPHDFSLPPLDNNAYVNFGCSFCSRTTVALAPPPNIVTAPASPTPAQVYPSQPFGGGAYSYLGQYSALGG